MCMPTFSFFCDHFITSMSALSGLSGNRQGMFEKVRGGGEECEVEIQKDQVREITRSRVYREEGRWDKETIGSG